STTSSNISSLCRRSHEHLSMERAPTIRYTATAVAPKRMCAVAVIQSRAAQIFRRELIDQGIERSSTATGQDQVTRGSHAFTLHDGRYLLLGGAISPAHRRHACISEPTSATEPASPSSCGSMPHRIVQMLCGPRLVRHRSLSR